VKEAMFYEEAGDRRVRCRLCHHACLIEPDERGICRVRENRGGRFVSLVYGRLAAQAVDPIEKKPLYHFLPGSRAFSIGTRGCNFRCLHCQNCSISQVAAGEVLTDAPLVPPDQLVHCAEASSCACIAYTYTEPTIFYEYAYDTALLAKERGLKNVFITNGYITPEALRHIAPLLDAANIDLKFFREDLYRKVCGARLQPVLDTIRLYHELEVWTEITTLVIPDHNDDDAQLRQIAEFIADLSCDIPWHVTAFYPTYRLTDTAATPASALRHARSIGKAAGLNHVYLGNVDEHSDTLCPNCGTVLIERSMAGHGAIRMKHGKCPECGGALAGVWGGGDQK